MYTIFGHSINIFCFSMAVLVYLWVIVEQVNKFTKIRVGSIYLLFYFLLIFIGFVFFGVCVSIVLSKFSQKFVEIDLLYGYLAFHMFVTYFFGNLSKQYSDKHIKDKNIQKISLEEKCL
jgi:hypothetical protein